MKKKCFLSGLGVLFLVSLFMDSSYAIDPNTIIGLWYLDEGKGEVIIDSSGKKHDGNLTGDTEWVDGKFGKALQFDGQDDCVEIPFEGVPEQYTLSVWIYQESAAISPGDDGGYGQTILSSSSVEGGAGGYGFWLLSYNGEQIRFYAFESAPAVANSLLTEDKNISLEKWHHIAATAVKGEDSVIYVDGVEKARKKNDGEDPISTAYFIGDLRVGRRIAFNGIIDDVVIFDVVLPEADIAKIASKGISGAMAVSSSGKLPIIWGRIKKTIQD